MAPRGKDLSTEQKQTIVSMSKNGLSSRKISELIGISPNTVQKVLKRNSDRGSVENKERSGRKRLVSDRGDRVLERLVKKNRRQTLSDLTSVFNDSVPEQVSSRTVRRRLKEQCYQRCSVSKKITISKNNRQSRVSLSRSKLAWTVEENWSKVIFSDEMKVVLVKDKKVHVWRKPGERFQPACLGMYSSHSPHSGISAMFCGCLSYNGVGTLTEVEGNINSEKYISVLDNNLWPIVAKEFSDSPWMLQEDNCPVHQSRQTVAWKDENNIDTLTWPSQSPDINIIENVWRTIKIRLEHRLHEIKNRQDLIRVVKEIWASITSDTIKSLYTSIPKRLRAVIKAKGYITKY